MDFNKYYHKTKKRFSFKIIFYILLILLSITIIIFIFYFLDRNQSKIATKKPENISKEYIRLFQEKNYFSLIEKLDIEIDKNPFQSDYLTFRGFSFFLLGEDEKKIESRKKYFSLSILDLRKVLSIQQNSKNIADIYFCIGKIYYYFGEPYFKQSIEYLNKSILSGNKRNDLNYVLGLIYSHKGQYQESISFFKESIKNKDNELALLALSYAYNKNNDPENAKTTLLKVINISNDPKIKEKSLLLYGQILFNQGLYQQSLEYFEQAIVINENSAEAYFYRGEIFYTQNDLVKARSNWRKTLEIDPSHILALKRIY